MCALPAGLEAAFDAGIVRCCANAPRKAEWAELRVGFLARYQEQPASSGAATNLGRAAEELVKATRQITTSRGGQVFDRLMRNEEYAKAYERGYDSGRQDGADFALRAWKTEVAELIVALAQGLTTCMQDPDFLAKLTAAAVQEYVLVPLGLRKHPWKDRRYDTLRMCLQAGIRPGPPARPGTAVPAPSDSDAGMPDVGSPGAESQVVVGPDPDEADAAAAAAWAYEVGQVPNQVSDIGLIDALDIMAADWVGAMRADFELLLKGIVELNGQPCEQGYFVGWYVSHVVVQTLRWFVETATQLAGPL